MASLCAAVHSGSISHHLDPLSKRLNEALTSDFSSSLTGPGPGSEIIQS